MVPLPAIVCMHAALSPAAGGIAPFDGRTLDGWEGDRAFWTVEDGAIVGRSTAERPCTASTYLAWTGDMPADFELRCRVRIAAGNSGIQYRSHRVDGQADMAGFQADLDAANAYTGILYEGLGRAVMSGRGEQVEWSPSGPRTVARFAPEERLRGVMRPGEWNDYRIEARGTRVRHWVNGTLMTDVTDGDASRFRRDGQLAFQLHAGPPMEVRFRDIRVTPLVEAPPASAIAVPEGFEVRLLASAQPSQGSWVSIAFDPSGRAVVSPQQGRPWRLELPGVTPGFPPDAEVRATELGDVPGGAQGLAFIGGELWVDSGTPGDECGLWRLRDADGDGRFEGRTLVLRWPADGGEHGPHGVVAGPDGMVYVAVGNHVPLPDGVSRGICGPWGEDLVTERMWDPRGHAVGIVAPGGMVLRVDPSTNASEVFAMGFRNHYDLAFTPAGDLFTYDSDMEWDIGAPWYRAPRIVHVVRGGDYGWRSGSGAWPAWYPDSLPPACDTDAASPTGMLHGADGAFAGPWRDMLFAADWTYGRILAVRLTPDGSSFRGEWQPFASGRPMPVADMAWGPDGAMYVVTGGRGTQSGIYRIAARAPSPPAAAPHEHRAAATSPATHPPAPAARPPAPAAHPNAPAGELPASLGSGDRFVAFAARAELERRGDDAIRAARSHPDPAVRAAALLATARACGTDAVRDAVVQAAHDPGLRGTGPAPDRAAGHADDAPAPARVTALRAIAVARARHPSILAPGSGAVAAVAGFLEPGFAAEDPRDAELSIGLACALELPAAVPAAMRRLAAARDRADAIRWAAMLRTVRSGWDDASRAAYWSWLDRADDAAGGFSLRGFLDRMREDALAAVGRPLKPAGAADPARGARIFRESLCIQCHRVRGEGGANGPDLTGVAGRFSRADLLRAILEPNDAVSDQWRDSAVTLRDGSMVVGRVVGQDDVSLTLSTDPLGDARERVARTDIERIERLTTSSMPPGLLGARSREEILDLLAYLEGGGSGIGPIGTGATGTGAAGAAEGGGGGG